MSFRHAASRRWWCYHGDFAVDEEEAAALSVMS
jgi:hypothetical protein